MSQISITKKDLIWSYLSIFFQIGSGIIVLPFVLRKLTADEVGYNYVMLTISQMVTLFNTGFAPMFGKNLSYVFSGAKELKKEGIVESKSEDIDYHLLAILIKVGKVVYFRFGLIVLFLMLTGGTLYVYDVTHKFTLVPNALVIWVIYSVSIFFNLYYGYLDSLMTGRGYIMETKKAGIYSRITYIGISIGLLYCGLGLIGICIANFIAPFVTRFICLKKFYDPETKSLLKKEVVNRKERKDTFAIIWHNTKKMILVAIGAYCVNRVSLFLAGVFLPLSTVASYGLMLQFGGIIISISINYFITEQPKMAYYKIKGNIQALRNEFSTSWVCFIVLILSGFALLITLGPWILNILKSNTVLPATNIMIIYAIVTILEQNHSLCASLLVVGNRVPPVACSLIPGFAILILTWCCLNFTHFGLLGVVIIPGICQLVYNNWKWPLEALRELNMNIFQVFDVGIKDIYFKLRPSFK